MEHRLRTEPQPESFDEEENMGEVSKMENMVAITEHDILEHMFCTEQQTENSEDEDDMEDVAKIKNMTTITEQDKFEHVFRTQQQSGSCEEDYDLAKNGLQHDFCGMFDEENDPVNRIPEGYLPFNCSVLTKELIDYAAKHLNETEEVKEKGLKELSEFCRNEINFDFNLGEKSLLCFLRTTKYDLIRTFQLVKTFSEFMDSHRYFYDKNNPALLRQVINSKIVGFLPYRDSKGRAIILVRAEWWNPDEIKTEDLIYGAFASLHTGMDNEVNQVAGYVLIFDFKNLSIKHIKGISRWTVVGCQAIQKCNPYMVKEFHVVHTPAIFRAVWSVAKHFLSQKMRNRFTFYKSTCWESLHSKIPPCILPEELGGHLGPYSPEHWASDIDRNEKEFNDRMTSFFKRHRKN